MRARCLNFKRYDYMLIYSASAVVFMAFGLAQALRFFRDDFKTEGARRSCFSRAPLLILAQLSRASPAGAPMYYPASPRCAA